MKIELSESANPTSLPLNDEFCQSDELLITAEPYNSMVTFPFLSEIKVSVLHMLSIWPYHWVIWKALCFYESVGLFLCLMYHFLNTKLHSQLY